MIGNSLNCLKFNPSARLLLQDLHDGGDQGVGVLMEGDIVEFHVFGLRRTEVAGVDQCMDIAKGSGPVQNGIGGDIFQGVGNALGRVNLVYAFKAFIEIQVAHGDHRFSPDYRLPAGSAGDAKNAKKEREQKTIPMWAWAVCISY